MELYKGKYWELVFYDNCQEFPGQCVFLNSKESLSDLTNDEWIELGIIEKELERVCKKVLGATMFNFCCLMNNAYRDNETPYVHFQFVPRYRDETIILNKNYVDTHFGFNLWKWAITDDAQKDIFTNEERLEIFNMIKKEFKL